MKEFKDMDLDSANKECADFLNPLVDMETQPSQEMKELHHILNKELGENTKKSDTKSFPVAVKKDSGSFSTKYAVNEGAGTSSNRPKRLSTSRYANCPLCDSTLTSLNASMHLEKEKERLSSWHQNIKRSEKKKGRKEERNRKCVRAKQVKDNDFLSIKARRNGRSLAMQDKLKPWLNAACPICATVFSSGAAEIFEHIYSCQNTEACPPTTHDSSESDLDVGSFSENIRLDIETLLQEAEITSASVVRLRNGDEDLPLDVEILDEEEFGEEQYTKNDIDLLNVKLRLESTADIPESSAHSSNTACTHNSSDDLSAASGSSVSQVDDKPGQNNLCQVVQASNEETHVDSDSVKTQLTLKIQELMHDSAVCAVCMGPYKIPLVSINCWHVLCEECWLRALAVSQLCPLCKDITHPGKLRKLYI